MLERLSPVRRRIALGVLAALVLWFLWSVRTVINPILLGYLLAYVLHPMVQKLERRGMSRQWAVGLIFTGFALALTLTALAIFMQGRSLWFDLNRDEGPFDRLWAEIEAAWAKYSRHLPFIGRDDSEGAGAPAQPLGLREAFGALWGWLKEEGRLAGAGQAGLKAAGGMWGAARSIFGGFFTLLLLLPIYTYFLLFELERIHGFVRRYIPRTERARMSSIGGQIGEVLSSFFRGRLLVCLLKGLFTTLGLWVTGVPYALIVGLLSGFLSLVPFVGPALGFVLAFLMALLGEYTLLSALLRVGAVYAIAELLEGYVLLPKILGDSLGMHPLVVLASLMIGGAALGMFGLLAALPLAATAIILTRELVLPAMRKVADEET